MRDGHDASVTPPATTGQRENADEIPARPHVRRAGTLTPDEITLARATKRAIQAAGGLDLCQRETGTSDSQLSRCSHPNMRDSIAVRDAVVIDDLRQDRRAPPAILDAQARILGFVLVDMPDAPGDGEDLRSSIVDLTGSLGDLAMGIRDALADGIVEDHEARAVLALKHELDRASAALGVKLQRFLEPNRT